MSIRFAVDETEYPLRVQSTRDVRQFECRWPIDNADKDDFSLCRQPVTRGSYCSCHALLAYTGIARVPAPMPSIHRPLRRAA